MKTRTETPSYQKELDHLQENLANMLPEEALGVFDTDARALQGSHQDILQLEEGDTAPDFTLPNATGTAKRLYEMLQGGKVVLVFYRGAWCPYCNLQLNQYQRVLEEIEDHGARLIAISPQTPDQSLTMAEKNDLAYEVLSDKGNQVARQYTTVFRNADAPVETMEALGIDFDGHYADDSRELPVPAVFIIDQHRQVIFAATEGGDYRQRVEAADILQTLAQSK